MAKHIHLNNIEHKNLKVITTRAEKFGDNVWYTQTFPSEFRAVQSCYPIFFQKFSDTGKFSPVTLFGFQHGENLFLNENGWNASYIPMTVLRQPFLIGKQHFVEDGREQERHVIHIDLESNRISEIEGEPLFKEFGGNTDYLNRMADFLGAIHQGLLDADQFIEALLSYDLLESFTMSITLDDGSQNELIGFYTINETKLKKLDAEAVVKLHTAGHLESIYMVLGSHARVTYLIEQKNRKLFTTTV